MRSRLILDESGSAARLFVAAHGVMIPLSALLQGIARLLSGDVDGGDAYVKESVIAGEQVGGPHLAIALAERSLLAIAREEWGKAEVLANQASTVAPSRDRRSVATSPVCAIQARAALHMGDAEAARQQAFRAQRMLPWLSYTFPYLAVQARMELIRVYIALNDVAGARTFLREINEVFTQRPDLGTLVGEAEALQAQFSKKRGTSGAGASALTTAELRLLMLLPTHLPARQIAAEMFLSTHTIQSQMKSIHRKLGASTRGQASPGPVSLGSWKADDLPLPPSVFQLMDDSRFD